MGSHGTMCTCAPRVFVRLPCRLKLKSLHKFTSTATAVEEITAIQEGKLGKGLKQFLSDEIVGKGKSKDKKAGGKGEVPKGQSPDKNGGKK